MFDSSNLHFVLQNSHLDWNDLHMVSAENYLCMSLQMFGGFTVLKRDLCLKAFYLQ